ncbi:MAG: sulfite exporter TauE/SafE family protein [Pseudomonadota bacterium]
MLDAYTPLQIAIIFAVYLGAATAKGVTGLGFSTTCLPFLAATIGLKEALPLLIIPSISSNIMVQIGARQFVPTLRRFWPMLLATLPGLVLGLWLLDQVDGATAAAVLGLVLVGYCVFAWSRPDLRLPARFEKPFGPVSGFLTGTINGITGSQVMPSMPYLMSLHLDRNMFLQAINCSFTLSSIVMMIGLSRLGLVPITAIWVSILGIGFAIFGIRLGERIRDRLDPDQFRLAVLGMLTLLGLSLIVRGVL